MLRTAIFVNGLPRNAYAAVYNHEGMILVQLEMLKACQMLLGSVKLCLTNDIITYTRNVKTWKHYARTL